MRPKRFKIGRADTFVLYWFGEGVFGNEKMKIGS